MDAIEKERARRRKQVALGYRILASLRWGDLGDGHITARDPEHTDCMWMLAYGVDFGKATTADLVLLQPDGTPKDPNDTRVVNEAGYYIHHAVHMARPDLVSATHCHSTWGTPFAAECRLLDPISQESTAFWNDHSMYDGEEVQVMDLDTGHRIAEALGNNRAVILRNHGLLAGGESVAASVATFVSMERVAEVHMKARQAKPISPAAAQIAHDSLARHESWIGNFNYLVKRHIPDPSVVVND